MPAIIKIMGPLRAVGILDGHITWDDPEEYLEAALYVSLHPSLCRELMAAALYKVALMVADYAVDHGQEAAIQLLKDTKS